MKKLAIAIGLLVVLAVVAIAAAALKNDARRANGRALFVRF